VKQQDFEWIAAGFQVTPDPERFQKIIQSRAGMGMV
jgi:hypothetical protein